MSTTQARLTLGEKNQALREQYNRLKIKKDQIADHLATILKRSKQMQSLKKSLLLDLQSALEKSKLNRNKKAAYIGFLVTDIKKLQEDLLLESTHFKKLQGEYQICLQDYDHILRVVTEEIQSCKVIQAEIMLEKENNTSMKNMIFDYERLKRVLEQERRYFKQLSSTEQKSHEERVKELENILSKLVHEEKNTQQKLNLYKYRSGFTRIIRIFQQRKKQYAGFIRQQLSLSRKTRLGIHIFQNCLQLASLKHRLRKKNLFYKWHHNVFPKQILRNLVENTTIANLQSFQKIRILNMMSDQQYTKNIEVFQLYEKGKYLEILVNKNLRKDLHYGFCKWRQNYFQQTETLNKLKVVLTKTIPFILKKNAFKGWRQQSSFESRLILANKLLQQYIKTKDLSRMFRKWRLQVPNHQLLVTDNFLYKMKLRGKILSKINYEKRKSKILTSLAFKFQKIQLRNYFIKYWANVKSTRIQDQRETVLENKEKFSLARAQHKNLVSRVEATNQKISLKVFRVFMMNTKLRPALKKWRNTMFYLRKRSSLIFNLCMKKEIKIKTIIMNQFRKCVQYFEKKQMHQVLTDLNNKMEAINEKSTNFRQRLKKCIEDLGIMASKKLDTVFNQTIEKQERAYFDTYIRKKVKKLYYEYIFYRANCILTLYGEKKGLNELAINLRFKKREAKVNQIEDKYRRQKQEKLKNLIFYRLKGSVKGHKESFKKMGQSENILMFYRMACAFVSVERKSWAQKVKSIQKKIQGNEAILKTKEDNIGNLEDQKSKLEESLKKIFIRFVNFENINMDIKSKQTLEKLKKRYFSKYRENVQQKIYIERILLHFSDFISQKNKMIFWKGANAIRVENTIALVKQELAKLNKKKKAFEEKDSKGRGDIEKRLEEAESIHSQKFQYYDYYLKKFENTLKFYEESHYRKEKEYYAKQIFSAWKKQYRGAKGLFQGTNNIYQRNLVHHGFQEISKMIRKANLQLKSQYLCAQILERKGLNSMRDCLILWRCNLRKMKTQKLEEEANRMIENREDVAIECKSVRVLVAEERVRMKRKRILTSCFMAFKTEVTEKKYVERYAIEPMKWKNRQRYLRIAMKSFKWLMFYKRTKRAYLKYKKEKFQRQLKQDVFKSLKIYREQHYQLVARAQAAYDNLKMPKLRFALNKILNQGAIQRDRLNEQRKRALRHLVMNKVTKTYLIKRKIMAKWYAWLIPRKHYLPVILKDLEKVAMRRYFANIKEHAYWNPIYIKKMADNVTSEGYSEINSATNNLVKEGFDPDEIKQYLTKKNLKDTKTIKVVVNKIKSWGKKQDLVRAWNSWKQYLELKKKIRKSLSKVIFIVQGIGRYWNRWRSKDPQFNAILQKQSRGNMLQRYKDLGRLMKEYKRDVKESKIYCHELKTVNDEYSQKNDEGIRIGLSALSKNLKRGMKQGLQIWRSKVKQFKKVALDQKYQQLTQGISILLDQKNKLRYKLISIQEENKQMKQKCIMGKECGQILEKLLRQKDNLSIDLADKQHNLKLLLEDNLRLKQKIRLAKSNAQKLISKVHNFENEHK